LQTIYTWILALLLVGMGSILPYTITYFFYPDTLHFYPQRSVWAMANPFLSIDEGVSDPQYRPKSWVRKPSTPVNPSGADVFDAPCLPFLGVWATLVTLLSVPGVVQQATRFRRDEPPEPEPVIVVPEEEPPRAVTGMKVAPAPEQFGLGGPT